MNSINKCLSNRKISGRLQKTAPAMLKKVETDDDEVENDTIEDDDDEEDSSDNTKNSDTPPAVKEPEASDEDRKSEIVEESMEGSRPAEPAQPGTLKATLLETPSINQITEKESAHPSSQLLNEIATAEKPSTSINDITNGEADLSIENKSNTPITSPTVTLKRAINTRGSIRVTHNPQQNSSVWRPSSEWVQSWR
jgi:hypothetical protein